MKKTELLLEQVDKLRNIKLPAGWEVAKLDVVFEKKDVSNMYKSAFVIYDDMNDTFYVKTSKSIVYESEKDSMQEAIQVMEKANNIIKNN